MFGAPESFSTSSSAALLHFGLVFCLTSKLSLRHMIVFIYANSIYRDGERDFRCDLGREARFGKRTMGKYFRQRKGSSSKDVDERS